MYHFDGGVELTASGRRKRKDAGTKWQGDYKARGWTDANNRWTDDEKRLFLEALELYGRDWKKVRVWCLGGVSLGVSSFSRGAAWVTYVEPRPAMLPVGCRARPTPPSWPVCG